MIADSNKLRHPPCCHLIQSWIISFFSICTSHCLLISFCILSFPLLQSSAIMSVVRHKVAILVNCYIKFFTIMRCCLKLSICKCFNYTFMFAYKYTLYIRFYCMSNQNLFCPIINVNVTWVYKKTSLSNKNWHHVSHKTS